MDEEAALGIAGHDRRTSAATFQKTVSILERNVAVVQFVVMAAKTTLAQDGCDLSIEEPRPIRRRPSRECRAREKNQKKRNPIHF